MEVPNLSLWFTRVRLVLDIGGAFFIALDIIRKDGLERLRDNLIHFSELMKKARIIPFNYLQVAYLFALSEGKSKSKKEIEIIYNQKLNEMGIDKDYLSYQFMMRSAFLICFEIVIIALLTFIFYKNGASFVFSREGYQPALALLLGMVGGLFWYSRALFFHERCRDEDRIPIPTIFDFGFSPRKGLFIPLAFLAFNIIFTVILKVLAAVVGFCIYIEKFTRPHQAPRVLGFILLLLGFAFQLCATFIQSK